jgi:hypothetical protein
MPFPSRNIRTDPNVAMLALLRAAEKAFPLADRQRALRAVGFPVKDPYMVAPSCRTLFRVTFGWSDHGLTYHAITLSVRPSPPRFMRRKPQRRTMRKRGCVLTMPTRCTRFC